MRRFKRIASMLCSSMLLMTMFASTGCRWKSKNDPDETKKPVTETTAAPTFTPSPTPTFTPTPTPDPAKIIRDQATTLAKELGVPEDDLHGEYELFLEYADAVLSNPYCQEYRGYVIRMFPVVADQLKEENKETFFQELRRLECNTIQLVSTHAGEYSCNNGNTVMISDTELLGDEKSYCSTVYHELMHSIDYTIDGEQNNNLYFVGKELKSRDQMTDSDWNDLGEVPNSSFFVEGGCELFTAQYIMKATRTYGSMTAFFFGLEYIIGVEKVQEMFFSHDTAIDFANFLRECGYDDKKIGDIFDSFSYYAYSYDSGTITPKNPVSIEDVLIDVYQAKKGDGWKEDKVFAFLMDVVEDQYFFEGKYEHEEYIRSCQKEYEVWSEWNNRISAQIDWEGEEQILTWGEQPLIYLDGKIYLSYVVTDYDPVPKYPNGRTLVLEYDFENEKVLSQQFYDIPVPSKIPAPLDAGPELDARLSELKHDNSAMHSQSLPTGTKTDYDYAKATEIANKYGVSIRSFEQMTEEMQYWFSAAPKERFNKAILKIDEVLGQYPEGFFDQLNYGNWHGMVIYVVDFTWDGIKFQHLYEDGKDYMAIVIGTETDEEIENYDRILTNAIFHYADYRMMSYYENFKSPSFSDAQWKKQNPYDFMYQGNNTEDVVKPYYDQYKDYVVSFEAMESARDDRSHLMSELMASGIEQKKATGDSDGDSSGSKKNADNSKTLTKECLNKAEYYCKSLREAFDTTNWPEKTIWEQEMERQIELLNTDS